MSIVHDAEFMVAVDVEEREAGRTGYTTVRIASAIEPEWLFDVHPDLLVHQESLVWNADRERVERVSRLTCGSVLLEETRSPAEPSSNTARLVAERVLAASRTSEELERLSVRLELLAEHLGPLAPPIPSDETLTALIAKACEGATSLAELGAASVAERVVMGLSPAHARLLAEEAPERLQLPGSRSVRVEYERGKPPYIASRLQDFFGMKHTPKLCRGRVPLTVHLLAPNQRAVQVTNDVEGFWIKHYPGIRKELMRKYPRHAWPEDGATATPPAPRPPRRG
jgi:ATP-dependent helicase HrpB